MEKYLECAKIVGTHGVHGAVRLSSMCDSPAVLASLKRMYYRRGAALEELCVKSAFVHKSMVVASFDGVDSLDGAIAMRDLVLYADRDDIPRHDGDFFISDLIGLSVKDAESGEVYGTLSDVISPAGHDICKEAVRRRIHDPLRRRIRKADFSRGGSRDFRKAYRGNDGLIRRRRKGSSE